MATYLDTIVAHHRQRADADTRSERELEALVAAAPPVRPFRAALEHVPGRAGEVAVIAEVKRRSPIRGALAPDLDPSALAAAYTRGGAACLSVLTDEAHFSGSADDLRAARRASALPVLRKDFTVAPADVYDARAMGADAVLLIVAALDDGELAGFVELAGRLGLDALVEVHDEGEVDRALHAGATLVGVNQRDLHSFEVDTKRAVHVAGALPDAVTTVAESGISTRADVEVLAAAGFSAVLVGGALVTAHDPEQAVRDLAGRPRAEAKA